MLFVSLESLDWVIISNFCLVELYPQLSLSTTSLVALVLQDLQLLQTTSMNVSASISYSSVKRNELLRCAVDSADARTYYYMTTKVNMLTVKR